MQFVPTPDRIARSDATPRAVRAVLLGVVLVAASSFMLAAPAEPAQAKSQRIVALTPFAANTMALLGVQPKAVGQTLGGDRRLLPVLSTTRVLPLSHPNGPNLEQLAQIGPKVVFSSPRWAKGSEGMRQLGIKVIQADPKNLGAVYRQTRMISRVVGRQKKGRQLVRRMRKQLRKKTANIRRRPKVMLILGVGRTPYTFLGNSWGGQLIKRSGGRLLTGGATASGGFARISDETVIAENPDVIIGVPHANTEDIPAMVEYIKNNSAWDSTNAVKNDRVYVSTDNSMLQAGTDVARVIGKIRKNYLNNR
ncbi:MAG: ABC transporter substrate-binding protein [Solirubrobacterales bacterium]|nr:ABC transporter substrate-binding protein [Solirubrobacterales bacterium]